MSDNIPTMAELFRSCAHRPSEKIAIIAGREKMTYGEMLAAGSSLVRDLEDQGVSPGDFVYVNINTKIRFIITIVALLSRGYVVVPRTTSDEQALEKLLEIYDVRAVIHDGNSIQGFGREISRVEWQGLTWSANQIVDDFGALPAPEAPAMIIFSSGTEGDRKGIVCTHRSLAATTLYLTQFMHLNEDIVEHVIAPVNHAFGFGRVRCVLAIGGTLVVDDGESFNPLKSLVLMKRHRCNAISGTSTAYALFLEHLLERFLDHGRNLKWFEIGSLPLRKELADILIKNFPTSHVVMNFGMTEAQRSTLVDFVQDPWATDTVGPAAPGCRIEIRDSDGNLCPVGKAGTIWITGPHIAAGYWCNPKATAMSFVDGWFKTEDVGNLDDRGFLRFIGRKDDMLNIGGENVSPVVIEQAIQDQMNGQTFCISAIEDPEGVYGDIPVLCIEGSDPTSLTIENIRVRLSPVLTSHHIPRGLIFLSEFPRTLNGKVRRGALRDALAAQDVSLI